MNVYGEKYTRLNENLQIARYIAQTSTEWQKITSKYLTQRSNI